MVLEGILGGGDKQEDGSSSSGIMDMLTGGSTEENATADSSLLDTTSTSTDEETKKDPKREAYLEKISDDRAGFILHQGEILETHTYDTIFSTSWNSDYEGISSDGSISLPFHKEDLQYIYKGVRCLLKTKRFNNFDDKIEIDDSEGWLCFITDVSIDNNKLDLTLSGFEKLLEQENILSFTALRRSVILREVIKMAGLEPVIDTTGLPDEVINWSTEKQSDKENDQSGGGYNVSGDGSWTEQMLEELAPQLKYEHLGSGHDPQKGYDIVTKNKAGDCYDVTAFAYYVYNFKIGIPCRDIVGKGYGASGTHHVAMILKDGDWVFPSWYDKVTTNLKVTSGMKKGDYKVSREPPDSSGNIPAYRNDWYGNRS